jgi:hypothetical protein
LRVLVLLDDLDGTEYCGLIQCDVMSTDKMRGDREGIRTFSVRSRARNTCALAPSPNRLLTTNRLKTSLECWVSLAHSSDEVHAPIAAVDWAKGKVQRFGVVATSTTTTIWTASSVSSLPI